MDVIERVDMFEGRLLDIDAEKIQAAIQALSVQVADYRARMTKQYGIEFDKGDSVDLRSGAIQRAPRKEPEAAPPAQEQEAA